MNNDKNKKEQSDFEKSEDLAKVIEAIKLELHKNFFDIDHAKKMVEALKDRSTMYDAGAVLNLDWNDKGSKLISKQADALNHLIKFVECLMDVDKLKFNITQDRKTRNEIKEMFKLF